MKMIIVGAGATAFSEHANPDSIGSKSHEWVGYHNSIFNASSSECYRDLLKYTASLN